ncbi:MAG: hypothetical protein DBY04_03425 [Clostridiales bacterium]|nr:MAG: hypothetical protein DBY04_03425 [Clostridiales bacterium]
MAKPQKNRWQKICKFLAEYMTPEDSYKAGALYEIFLKDHPIDIFDDPLAMRKDFEMCLRYEVEKENGFLKRVSHGVYTVRTDPLDRGVNFSRNNSAEPSDPQAVPVVISLDEVLDNSVEIAKKGKKFFSILENQDLPTTMQLELSKLKSKFMRDLDDVITNITVVMAWCEDNLECLEEESSLTMDFC